MTRYVAPNEPTAGSNQMNKLADEIHRVACSKGWWDKPRSVLEIAALIHSEISEAVEAAREPDNALVWTDAEGKPEGVAVEMVDAMIRILDYLASVHVDIDHILKLKMHYNRSRSYRHGGRTF